MTPLLRENRPSVRTSDRRIRNTPPAQFAKLVLRAKKAAAHRALAYRNTH